MNEVNFSLKFLFKFFVLVCAFVLILQPVKAGEWSPVGITFAFGDISYQFPSKDYSIRGMRLNLFRGKHENLTGVDLGLGNKLSKFGYLKGIQIGGKNYGGRMRGLQLGAVNDNLTERDSDNYGLQFGLFNTSDNFSGFQVGLVNWAAEVDGFQIDFLGKVPILSRHVTKNIQGIQMGGLSSVAKNIQGIQMGGLSSVAKNVQGMQMSGYASFVDDAGELQGIQMSGLGSIADISCTDDITIIQASLLGNKVGFSKDAEAKVIQVGGIFNSVGDLGMRFGKIQGMQIGLVNKCVFVDQIQGVQLGIYNSASNLTGVQIGIINLADSLTGLQIGLLNGDNNEGILPVSRFSF